MGGFSGSRSAEHTPMVRLGGNEFAVTTAQRKLIDKAIGGGGAIRASSPRAYRDPPR